MADTDHLKFVLDRFVGAPSESTLRITFASGEVFVLRNLSEVEDDAPEDERDEVGLWSGEIVARTNLDPERAKLFVVGSGIDFAGSEVVEVMDEETAEVLYSSPAPPR